MTHFVLARLLPARPLGIEGRLLARLEGGDARGIRVDESEIVLTRNRARNDLDVALAFEKPIAKVEKLFARDGKEPDLVEEAQQPRLAVLERVGRAVACSTSGRCARTN